MAKRKKAQRTDIRHIVVISDIHAGSSYSIRPKEFITDFGDLSMYSDHQRYLWECWREFWDVHVPGVTKNEPWALVVNGDLIEGRHHKSPSQVSGNLADHHKICYGLLEPLVKKAAKTYIVRGTQAHAGITAEDEERIAAHLGTEQNSSGHFSFWDLRLTTPSGWRLHFAHHIGTTSSAAYESSAPMREICNHILERALWEQQPDDLLIRSHRHRPFALRKPSARGEIGIEITPAWQLATEYVKGYQPNAIPQIGGLVITDECPEYLPVVRKRVWAPDQTESKKLTR